MRKNKTMRVAALLLALVLITSCFVGGTFAKYITSVEDTDNVRIAHWGFAKETGDFPSIPGWNFPDAPSFDLFAKEYDEGVSDKSVVSGNGDKVVAPGTTKEAEILFVYKDSGIEGVDAPEVDYNLTVSASLSAHELLDPQNDRLDWYVKYTPEGEEEVKVEYATYEELLRGIAGLVGTEVDYTYSEKDGAAVSCTQKYEAGTLPTWLTKDNTLTIGWGWNFEDAGKTVEWDETDTYYGNLSAVYGYADKLTFTIALTAEQID